MGLRGLGFRVRGFGVWGVWGFWLRGLGFRVMGFEYLGVWFFWGFRGLAMGFDGALWV